jgi:cohesin complex subunit SCC1
MLDDTSDICLQTRIHPADWTDDDTTRPKFNLCNRLPYDKLIVRPEFADDAAAAPVLLHLWLQNTSEARGKGKTFRLRGKAGEEQQAKRRIEEDALAEEVEIGRQGRDSEQGEAQQQSLDDIDFPQDNEFPEPEQGDDDMQIPFDDEFEAPHQDEEDVAANAGMNSSGTAFELGLVNDFEADLERDPRQAAGSDLVSSDSKWHKHTVKVLSMLKNQMSNGEEEGEDAVPKGSGLSYDKLSKGCSRHTAASVFFELLQLKTWDFIELDQEESYGDIQVSQNQHDEATCKARSIIEPNVCALLLTDYPWCPFQ